jgi:hypothetical protein
MGLFSNLFGDSGKDLDNALNKMKNMADNFIDEDEARMRKNQQTASAPADAQAMNNRRPEPVAAAEGPSGDSWGPVMPAEPNQYNSGLGYQDYFSSVFNEAFGAYQIDKEDVRDGRAMTFTFSQAGVKKLVVEVISEKSNPYKVRNECRKQGVAYLRYYYDYDGWWNTKSYVTRRTSKALGLG